VAYLFRSPAENYVSAFSSGAGSHIDHMVTGGYGVLIMFHHEDRVSYIPQILQGCYKHVVITLVQTD